MNGLAFFCFLSVAIILLPMCPAAAADAAAGIPQEIGAVKSSGKDMEAPPDTAFSLTDRLHLGLEVELEYTGERNFDLDGNTSDKPGVVQFQTSTALAYQPNAATRFFLEAELARDFVFDQQEEEEDLTTLELNELNLTLQEAPGRVKLELGRIAFKDERQWLYDKGLDGLRLSWSHGGVVAALSAARKNTIEVLHGGEDDSADYYELRLDRAPEDGRAFSFYALTRRDREGGREEPFFVGVHSHGPLLASLEYWLELARAGGRSAAGRIEAMGLDFGIVRTFGNLPYRPALILGYAWGSGDSDPADGKDRAFRQTGLQDNDGKLSGVVGSEYYGVMLQPELSNLQIFTAGIGIRPLKDTSLELIYHRYRQEEVSDALRDAEVNKDPNGRGKDLGYELDLVGGWESGQMKSKLVIGYFRPGDAFTDEAGRGDPAVFTEFTIQYEF